MLKQMVRSKDGKRGEQCGERQQRSCIGVPVIEMIIIDQIKRKV